jgi:uncharacterized membrane protein YeaQ/YmgE (transglycosylase-associated protein family)
MSSKHRRNQESSGQYDQYHYSLRICPTRRSFFRLVRKFWNLTDNRRLSLHPKGRNNVNIIILLVVGGVLGWLASIVMRTDGQQGIFLNVVVGIVGALLAGFIITPLIGGAPITSGSFDIMSLVASFLGAVVLLAIVNLVRRGSVR